MLLSLVRTYVQPYRRSIAALLGLQLVQTVANLILPSLNADIIDRGIATGDSGYIWRTGGVMLAMSAVQIVGTIGAVYFGSRVAMGLGRDLRAAVFGRVLAFSSREVDGFGAPSLITRTTNDVQQIQTVALMTCNMLVSTPIMVVGGVLMAIREDPGLSWLLLVCVPALVGSLGSIVIRLVPQYRVLQVRIDRINQVLREQITGIRVVRAFVREAFEARRFGVANDDVTQTSLAVGRLMTMMFPVVILVFNASTVAVLWFGAHRVDSGAVQIGGLIAFLTYLTQILMSAMMATFMATMLPRASVSAERVGTVLATESSVPLPSASVSELIAPGHVELRHAGFAYPGAADPVLTDASFVVRPGTTTAIVGSTGSGKTTLVNLIPRLFDVTAGAALVGGVDVRELDPAVLASKVGFVPQRPYLFSGTVASNLRYGRPDASEDELWAALRVAQAEDFVRAMPDGLDASISQGGTNVSGGQRQRLAIARALVGRPDAYVFDDSFSALDLATDARVRAALGPWTRDAAVIIVAQRISTITGADQIVVLDDGRIVDIGTHAELAERCRTYQEIVQSQLEAEDAA